MESVAQWKSNRKQAPTITPMSESPLLTANVPKKEPKKNILKEIGKEIIKLPTRMVANLDLAIQEMKAFGGDTKAAQKAQQLKTGGIDTKLGKISPIGVTGRGFGADVKDVFGAGLEAASYLPIARIPALGKQALTKGIPIAAKAFAKEGAIAGGVGGIGHEMQSPESTLGSVAKSGALGTVLGGAFGAGFGAATPVVGRALTSLIGKGAAREVPKLTVNEWKSAGKPKMTHEEYAKSQGYEPIVPDKDLPTIQMGDGIVPRKSTLPIIEAGESIPKASSKAQARFVPERVASVIEPRKAEPIKVEAPIPSPFKAETPVAVVPKPKDGEMKSRVFERMKNETPDIEGDVGYTPIKLRQEAEKAVDLIAKDKQEAFDIAMGKRVSNDITSTSANIALAEKALEEGNMTLYSRLVKNRSLAQTRRGQEIVSEKASVSDNSTSRYVKELVAARLEKLGSSYTTGIKEMIRGGSTKSRGISFLDKEVSKLETKVRTRKLSAQDAMKLLDAISCV